VIGKTRFDSQRGPIENYFISFPDLQEIRRQLAERDRKKGFSIWLESTVLRPWRAHFVA